MKVPMKLLWSYRRANYVSGWKDAIENLSLLCKLSYEYDTIPNEDPERISSNETKYHVQFYNED